MPHFSNESILLSIAFILGHVIEAAIAVAYMQYKDKKNEAPKVAPGK